jgi:4-carboxymuconolactone decarboxylase
MALNGKSPSASNAKEMKYTVLPERMPAIPPEKMSEAQRKVVADLVATRGQLQGPFVAAIRSPGFADRMQHLGAYIRYECKLDLRINRLVSLMVARHWSAQYEWNGAVAHGLKVGVDAAIIAALAEGRRPAKMAEDEAVVYEFMTELLTHKSVSDPTYERAVTKFGEPGVIDLLGVAGYYTMQAIIMNVVRTPVPGGKPLPLPPLPQGMGAIR